MIDSNIKETIVNIIENRPNDWVRLTTHRLDIYNESLAKVEFLQRLESADSTSTESLSSLPTAFDYIRLGHPLSCVLEWALAKDMGLNPESVISFSSQTMPLLAVLRANKFSKKKTKVFYKDSLPKGFDRDALVSVYRYDFELEKVESYNELSAFSGTTVTINGERGVKSDINLALYPGLGSVIEIFNNDGDYVKEVQHVRRRESIAMTPQNCLVALERFTGKEATALDVVDPAPLKETIHRITQGAGSIGLGNCGLSVQYAIMMGLVDHANVNHPEQNIKFIVPPNCYGGTNDQARRVAACVDNVEIVDLYVDNGKDMVTELERILAEAEKENAVPYIIAEIPTNPRVQIPDLVKLREVLKHPTKPVFILDQTFCPNVLFFGEHGYLRDVPTISYVSGSKFPSGGLVTAGYCVANKAADYLMDKVQEHLKICDNEATPLQVKTLTEEMPAMNERIAGAYRNTRAFVDHIQQELPEAKINFVTQELAEASFTPSVFSLDLPAQNEEHKQELNHKLIKMMIAAIPEESKHCVSYGQLKGCYWTIPATSTQGTTKESDKDYIVRVSVAADFNLEKHKEVFTQFVSENY
jgi:cystathionine beta-lyase/cystathionine gamma-synthase